jgi:hypothetical protein
MEENYNDNISKEALPAVDMSKLFKKLPGIAKAKEITATAELINPTKTSINEAVFTKTEYVDETTSDNSYDEYYERGFDPMSEYKRRFSTQTERQPSKFNTQSKGDIPKSKDINESRNLLETMRANGGLKGILENTSVQPKHNEIPVDPRIAKLIAQGKFTDAKKLNEELLNNVSKITVNKTNTKKREDILNEIKSSQKNIPSVSKSVLSEAEIKNIVLKTVVNDVFDNKKIDKIITEKVEKLFEDKINEMVNRKLSIALKKILSK